jgi:hypothetical protein
MSLERARQNLAAAEELTQQAATMMATPGAKTANITPAASLGMAAAQIHATRAVAEALVTIAEHLTAPPPKPDRSAGDL